MFSVKSISILRIKYTLQLQRQSLDCQTGKSQGYKGYSPEPFKREREGYVIQQMEAQNIERKNYTLIIKGLRLLVNRGARSSLPENKMNEIY